MYRKEYDYTDEAVAAAANLTVDHGLKLLYGTGGASAGGRRYLHAQFENLCRRSMIHSWDDDSFRRAFRFFLRKMVVWLNSSHINMVDAVELYGLGIRPTAKPFTISEFGTHEDYTRVVLEPGDLTDVGRRHHMLAPPSWDPENDPSPLRRAHACLVSIRSVKKSDDAMMIFTSDDSSGYRYIQTLGVVSGWRVRYGKSLWGEASEFPSHDTSTTEARTVVLDNEGGVLVHDRKLFHRTMALLPSVAAIEGTHRQLRSSVLAYAQRKYSRLLDGESAWYDQVVDVASALEALFGLPDEGSDLARRVAQRASWLADLSAAERIRLYKRVKNLYGVRSWVLHAGVIDRKQWDQALKALDAVPPGVDAHVGGVREDQYYRAWSETAYPRLVDLLRWALVTMMSLSDSPAASLVGWPLGTRDGARDLDRDMVAGSRRAEWLMAAKGADSPFARG